LTAARGQLREAIQLWFNHGDPVAVHTLAAASHDIIHFLFRERGHRGLLFDQIGLAPADRQKWASQLKAAANFFKHGRYDPKGSIEFDPILNELLMLASCTGLLRIGETLEGTEVAFIFWTFLRYPEGFDSWFGGKLRDLPELEALKKVAGDDRQMFFLTFTKAWESGEFSPEIRRWLMRGRRSVGRS
jgi:hypothetical protein